MLLRLFAGNIASFRYTSPVPFALELLEADFLPFGLNDTKKFIVQGVEKNRWGTPTAYHLYIQHPGDDSNFSLKTRRVSANNIIHLKCIKRCHQTRGVSLFASVLTRLEDLKQYAVEENQQNWTS